MNPLTVNGKKMDEQQIEEMHAKLPAYQLAKLQQAEANWNAAQAQIGFGSSIARTEVRGGSGGGGGGGGGAIAISSGGTKAFGGGKLRSALSRKPRLRSMRSSFKQPKLRVAKLRRSGMRFRTPKMRRSRVKKVLA
jgi:hypothetical protein